MHHRSLFVPPIFSTLGALSFASLAACSSTTTGFAEPDPQPTPDQQACPLPDPTSNPIPSSTAWWPDNSIPPPGAAPTSTSFNNDPPSPPDAGSSAPSSPPANGPSPGRGRGDRRICSTAGIDLVGACATREELLGSIVAEPTGCVVANEITDAETGDVSIDKVNGDRGGMRIVHGALVLECRQADKSVFKAVIRCFAGKGSYTVAAGDLLLGGKASDRTCTLDVDLDRAGAHGFIDCPSDPADPTNVFASSSAPIGLGTFDLPRVF
jgi:hypothetical protein